MLAWILKPSLFDRTSLSPVARVLEFPSFSIISLVLDLWAYSPSRESACSRFMPRLDGFYVFLVFPAGFSKHADSSPQLPIPRLVESSTSLDPPRYLDLLAQAPVEDSGASATRISITST